MTHRSLGSCCLLLFSVLVSCKNQSADSDENTPADIITPVTVTSVSQDTLQDYIELNATSVFLKKSYLKSNITGYIRSANAVFGKFVSKGETLFTIKTKESESIGNTLSAIDSSFRFSGTSVIRADASGYITEVDHQNGDYVQDGEQLAVISDQKSFVFMLNLPYELRPNLRNQKTVALSLPDGELLKGEVSAIMPFIDSASQTQQIVLTVNPPHPLPENLIAKVRIIKTSKVNTLSLPKSAVLTNETESAYWVMKMINDSVAVKIPVTKGIETDSSIEILSPRFLPTDRILVTGNYGLDDTAKVKIVP